MTEGHASAEEKLGIHQRLVNRIIARALAEGAPLTSVQIQQFDSDAMSKEQLREFNREFERENDWQGFLDRTSDLLRHAIAEDAAKEPEAPARYDAMVHAIEDRPESFTLWACCVPAIPGYKSSDGSRWHIFVVAILILAVIVFMVLHRLKIL